MSRTIRLNLVGDLCLQDIDAERFSIDDTVEKVLAEGDLNIANLEAPLTRSEEKRPYQPCYLKGIPFVNRLLQRFNGFSLANNHILDYSEKGLKDTLKFLDDAGFFYFGAGFSEKAACRPYRIRINGIELAFIGCTRWYNARKRHPGTAPFSIQKLSQIIRRLKAEQVFVIVVPHWNYEYMSYPSPIDRKKAHCLIDAGADLIVGSHPHQVQGYERYRGKYIFHSLGNFIFSDFDYENPAFSRTFILGVTIHEDHRYSVSVHPVHTSDHRLSSLNPSAETAFKDHLDKLSVPFRNDRIHKKLFYAHAGQMVVHAASAVKRTASGKERIKSILKRLPRIQRQDIYIQLHAMNGRLKKVVK